MDMDSLEIEVDVSEGYLPDMGVRVTFLEGLSSESEPAGQNKPTPERGGVLIPATAIVERDGGTVVFRVEEDRVDARKVVPGPAYGDLRLGHGGDQCLLTLLELA